MLGIHMTYLTPTTTPLFRNKITKNSLHLSGWANLNQDANFRFYTIFINSMATYQYARNSYDVPDANNCSFVSQ